MSRVALPEPENLDPFLREMHVNAREGDWSTKHVARAFSSHPRLLEDYLAFYYPWHSEPGLLGKRLKELVRLRIATFNGCQTCKAARLAPELISEAEVAGVDAAGSVPSYTPREQRTGVARTADDDGPIRRLRTSAGDSPTRVRHVHRMKRYRNRSRSVQRSRNVPEATRTWGA
jgi:hypothetical protein